MNSTAHKILLVDDNLTTIYLNKQLFTRADNSIELLTAPDGKKALEILQKLVAEGNSLPNVIVVDLKMPVMDGIEFYRQFKNTFTEQQIAETKVVMLTTSLAQIDLKRATEEGIDHYLNKPLTVDKIQATILITE